MKVKEMPTKNHLQLKSFSGDHLPSPKVLREYERIMPGVTKILIERAIHNMQSRIESERRALDANNLKSFAGLIFGFIIGILGLGGGLYLTFKGYNVIGIIFTSSTLVSLVMSFIYGSQSKRNRKHKNEDLVN